MTHVNVYLVRHGETIFNILDRLQGWSDTPLTERGIQLANNTGKNLSNVHFDQFVSSDSKRAIDTAKIISKYNDSLPEWPTLNPAFREVFFGGFEGLDNVASWAQVGSPYGAKTQTEMLESVSPRVVRDRMHKADQTGLAEDGETFFGRIENGLYDLAQSANENDNILVSTHGTLIRTLAITHGNGSFDAVHEFPDNGSITHLDVTENSIDVDRYNLTEI